jgi:hypothetical protein
LLGFAKFSIYHFLLLDFPRVFWSPIVFVLMLLDYIASLDYFNHVLRKRRLFFGGDK